MAGLISSNEFEGSHYPNVTDELLAKANGKSEKVVLPSDKNSDILRKNAIDAFEEGDLREALRNTARLWLFEGGKSKGEYAAKADNPLDLEQLHEHFVGAIKAGDYSYGRKILRAHLENFIPPDDFGPVKG